MRIGVYCGSFNPVHKGHVKIVREILKRNMVDQILVVPTGNYWHKQDLLSVEDRVSMWKIFENDQIRIDSVHNELVRTNDLFNALIEEDSSNEYCLILGADNLLRFSDWDKYENLLKYPFILIGRDNIGKKEIKEIMKGFHKENYQILPISNIDISATEIRENISDWSKLKGKIDIRVFRYIVRNNLYPKQ